MSGIKLVTASQPEPAQGRRIGVLVFGAIFLLLVGAAFGYSLRPEGDAAQTGHRIQFNAPEAEGSIVYGAVVAVAAVLLLMLIRSLGRRLPWRSARTNGLAGRDEKRVAEFVQEAKAMRIGLRVAREGYDLLQHHYPRPMCIEFEDNLRRDLKLTESNIFALRSELLGRTDRRPIRGADVTKIETVRDLFEQVEHAPMEAIDRTSMRLRITDLPFPARPVVENIEFMPSTPVADPDFLRRAHFNWLRRRDSDYKGFRSRATDEQASRYTGPFRRADEAERKKAAGEAKPSGSMFIPPRARPVRTGK